MVLSRRHRQNSKRGQNLCIEKLKNARIVDSNDVNVDVVSEYSYVKVVNLDTNEKMEFQIVGSVEAKPFEGKISNESPVGRAVLGHVIGDSVEVIIPAGLLRLRVEGITK